MKPDPPITLHAIVTDLLGRRVQAVAKPGWISDGGEPVTCVGTIHAVALDRGFIFIVTDKDGHFHNVWTLTHEIRLM